MVTILHIARSDISGFGLADPDRDSWPLVLGENLKQRTGLEIVTERRRLNVWTDPSEYLQGLIDEIQPDIIFTRVGSYDFAAAHIQNRLEDTVGKRLGDLARRIETKLQPAKSATPPNLVHRTIRRVGRRFIGTAPKLTRQQVTFATDALYRFLAQQENLVVIVKCTAPSPTLLQMNPGYGEVAEAFRDEWRQKARDRHFHWIDVNVGNTIEGNYLGDGIHWNEVGHRIVAREVEDTTMAALRDVVPSLRDLWAEAAATA